jgi:ATP-binding cassette subfamily C (CFTR/MRP) protein 1
VSGINSIRAYNLEHTFITKFQRQIDVNTKATFNMLYIKMWFSQRLDWIGSFVIMVGLCLICISRAAGNPLLSAAKSAMVLANLTNIAQVLSNATQNASEVETTMQSVERILENTNVEREEETEQTQQEYINYLKKEEKKQRIRDAKKQDSEPKKEVTKEVIIKENETIVKPLEHRHPPVAWPTRGDVKFVDYQMKYRPGLPLVLNGLNFEVTHGEKIGIVGRTGSGKSTMMVALYRIVEAFGGKIEIDGIDISSLYLHDLRKKLAIIPQEPSLFSGTLRFNLDPLEEYTDEEIWNAVELAQLTHMIKELPGGLNTEVAQSGSNFSIGERQLLCMARAVLRNAKILVMDEATASVDLQTDIMIQRMSRTAFTDCTVFTIAHRLHTIMDSSRVLVLDTGVVAEFDSPLKLLDNSNSILHSLAKEAGIKMLRKLAEGSIDIESCLKQQQKKKGHKKSKKVHKANEKNHKK